METGKKQGTYEVGKNKPPKATRFQPGKSGNPDGKKPGTRNTKTLLRELLLAELERENPLTKTKQRLSAEQLMHLGQIAKAIDEKDTRAYEAVLDRIDGRPTQTISNDPENPFESGGITLVFNTEKIEPVTSEAAMQAIFDKFKDG